MSVDTNFKLAQPRCHKRKCKHFEGVKSFGDGPLFEATQRPVCSAFPKGIPEEIAYGDNLHLEAFAGDNGIRYEREEP